VSCALALPVEPHSLEFHTAQSLKSLNLNKKDSRIHTLARWLLLGICLFLAACNEKSTPVVTLPSAPRATTSPSMPALSASPSPAVSLTPTLSPTPEPAPARLLTVCLGREPVSLFWYQAMSSLSARSVLQAIDDGPYDVRDYAYSPVILAGSPGLSDGEMTLVLADVSPGDVIVDAQGNLTVLAEGVRYRPPGCQDENCALAYSGNQPVQLERMSARFTLLPGLTWSDGAPLRADDSVYSYEVARALFPAGQLQILRYTATYQALDETSVEWQSIPGYRTPYPQAYFYHPLPRHAWGSLPVESLAESVAQAPLGWGPYVLEEWTAGDHITLRKNANYFRAQQGWPYFDFLVYRFVADGAEALDALLAGECDLIDPSAALELELPRLQQLAQEAKLAVAYLPNAAWEFAFFGVNSLDAGRPSLFASAEVRQAVALCVDRAKMAGLLGGPSQVLNTYLPASHPLYEASAAQYSYDPQASASLLDSAGWLDIDNDPATPRQSLGVTGVPDGTPFRFTYLVSPDAEREAAAIILQSSLAGCGIQVDLEFRDPAEYLAAGPGGPVFGRQFDMAQLALPVPSVPPCDYFTTGQIPGYSPQFSQGWGGLNASGWSNPEFDRWCATAQNSLAELPGWQDAHRQAQTIFAGQLPVLPLYTRFQVIAYRTDLCGLEIGNQASAFLWNLETWMTGESCRQP